jgi:hypothetical protein
VGAAAQRQTSRLGDSPGFGANLLQKPFSARDLATKVREVLDATNHTRKVLASFASAALGAFLGYPSPCRTSVPESVPDSVADASMPASMQVGQGPLSVQ